jgi:nucleotide-binding universal stress UspA family protein
MLVPLDGSDLAETILPLVEQVAGPLEAEVILLRVVEPVSTAAALVSAGVVSPDTLARHELEAKRYLAQMEPRLAKKGLRVRTQVANGPPAKEILVAAQAISADLIAMVTHGRSGLGRVLLGSVAEAVLRASPVPVLLIRNAAKTDDRTGHGTQPGQYA